MFKAANIFFALHFIPRFVEPKALLTLIANVLFGGEVSIAFVVIIIECAIGAVRCRALAARQALEFVVSQPGVRVRVKVLAYNIREAHIWKLGINAM